MRKFRRISWWLWYALVLGVIIIDRWTKIVAQEHLNLGESIPWIEGWFSLTLVYNEGAAFGLLAGARWLFVAAAVVLLVVLVWQRHVLAAQTGTARFAVGLLVGGVVGNFLDRMVLGYVIDFLHFHYWPVFNVADMAIVIGAAILAWEVVRYERQQNHDGAI